MYKHIVKIPRPTAVIKMIMCYNSYTLSGPVLWDQSMCQEVFMQVTYSQPGVDDDVNSRTLQKN